MRQGGRFSLFDPVFFCLRVFFSPPRIFKLSDVGWTFLSDSVSPRKNARLVSKSPLSSDSHPNRTRVAFPTHCHDKTPKSRPPFFWLQVNCDDFESWHQPRSIAREASCLVCNRFNSSAFAEHPQQAIVWRTNNLVVVHKRGGSNPVVDRMISLKTQLAPIHGT